MIQSCIGPNSVGRLVQYDQRMNATNNAFLLQENLSESISDLRESRKIFTFSAS